MIDSGYDFIIDRIINRTIDLPKSGTMTLQELNAFMTGYAKCQHDILSILLELKKGNKLCAYQI